MLLDRLAEHDVPVLSLVGRAGACFGLVVMVAHSLVTKHWVDVACFPQHQVPFAQQTFEQAPAGGRCHRAAVPTCQQDEPHCLPI